MSMLESWRSCDAGSMDEFSCKGPRTRKAHSLSRRRTIGTPSRDLMPEDLESLDLEGEVRRNIYTFS